MGDTDAEIISMGNSHRVGKRNHKAFDPSFLLQLPNKLQNGLESQLRKLVKDNDGTTTVRKEGPPTALRIIDLERQLQTWRENPSWVDQPPEVKVSVPKGSLCNLNVNCNVGLPPDAVFNIVTDPDNQRVFRNIKEVISRKVLLDEGHRQVVELEQAAIWKFLWWSGTFSVHVLVDQNRQDLTMKFKQIKTGFMKKFEGCWTLEPLFIDENMCYPSKPETWGDYNSYTGGKGRVGSKVSLEQLIQPALIPPPPISWYLRGITSKTTEMILYDMFDEAARIRGDFNSVRFKESETSHDLYDENRTGKASDIKKRWAVYRRNAKKHYRRLLTAERLN